MWGRVVAHLPIARLSATDGKARRLVQDNACRCSLVQCSKSNWVARDRCVRVATAFNWTHEQRRAHRQRGLRWGGNCRAARGAGVGSGAAAGQPTERHGLSAELDQHGAASNVPAAAAAGLATNDFAPAAAAEPSAVQAATAPSLSLLELWQLLQPDRGRLVACIAFTALSVCTAVLVAPSLGRVIDTISRGTAATQHDLALAVGRLGAVYIISNLSLAAQVALSLALGEALAHRLRCRLFGALLSRDTLFFDQVKTGQMVAWLGQDVEVLQSTVAKLLGARGIRSAFETCGIILMLTALSWPLAVALLVSAPLLTPLIARLSTAIGIAAKASQVATSNVSAAASEIVENMRVVKLFAQQHRELTRFTRLLDGAHELSLKVLRLQALLDGSSRVRNTLCVLATLSLGSYMAFNSAVSIGTCYSFFVFSFSFAFALGNLTNTVGDVARAAGAINRAMQTMQQALGTHTPQAAAAVLAAADATAGKASTLASDAKRVESVSSSTQQQGHQLAHERRQLLDSSWQGDIEFRGVNFSHPGWSSWTLQDLNFRIPAGKTVALVGPSGGGKSTIASLLMGLYLPGRGEILVDGVPLSQLDMQWWRRQLGVVMQSPGLLSGRIADIIRYGQPDASDAEVAWAACAAQADGFIEALPQGYQTAVGSGSGMELSGGQQQRLAIARALLPRPRLLIFDEATSALDVETEQGVTQALEFAGRGVTSLVIAHRLSTVRRADLIIVVADGTVVEQGTHAQLMQRQGGVYWSLVSSAESRGQQSWDMPEATHAAGAQHPPVHELAAIS